MLTIKVGLDEFTLSDVEEKALNFGYTVEKPVDLIKFLLQEEAKKNIDNMVLKYSDKNPAKITVTEKEQIISKVVV